ncbi:MAG TPA: 4-alpha-glucanotransferase [Pyrinomonadaceae bacterium]|nr:4-alpha-glucanotransferase [Pyrinomonadaceae bacterium]
MKFPRASGILLHPTSLPGKFGIGDLGSAAFDFIDFLAETGQAYWQILPLGPTGYGDSPYQCFSAFSGNTLLISPEKLVEDELLTTEQIDTRPDFAEGRVDFGGVYNWKNQLLQLAFENFHHVTSVDLRGKFETFTQDHAWWLDDYAMYRAVKKSQGQRAWYDWQEPLKLRHEDALAKAAEELYDEIQAEKFYQFLFFKQWAALKERAGEKGIKIIGDIPIFIALDSADVWRYQDKFKLNPDGSAKVVAGVPPDYFSKTGQLWGNPIYDWDAMRRDGFKWWIDRVRHTLETVDIVRVDHFRGFAAAWEVPGGDATAENGRWVDVPGKELFTALQNALGTLPVIAEDLGVITPDVEELRDSFGFPGMKILQFAFGGDAKNHDLPHNYINNCAAYTGTHDNDTTVGWWHSQAGAGSTRDEKAISREHDYCLKYLDSDGTEINWDFIRAVWASVADTAIAPMQDLLGLGTEGRMNLPASTEGNWYWRYLDGAVTEGIRARLKELTEIYGRNEK